MTNRKLFAGRVWPRVLVVLGGILLVLLLLAAFNHQRLLRVYRVNHLFDRDVVVENFRHMDRMFPTSIVRRGGAPHVFESMHSVLPASYEFRGQVKQVDAFLESTWTTGLLVLVNGHLAFERYYRGNDEATRSISWSVAKSFISALVGIAVEEGHIDDIMQPVTDYVPALRGSGYDGVPIKHILQMSSGVKFDEDYGDFDSDINRMGRAIAFNTPLDEFVATLQPERAPGTYHHYVSMDTQVLAMLLREATGESLTRYLESRLWQPMGMESDAYWLVDGAGMELAFGGLNAVLRDYARFGQLYLQKGEWHGRQLVPAHWVQASVTPDAPHLQPGEDNPASDWVMGYGYQWWIPDPPQGDFLAIGVYNQFVYVDPARGVVIAKSSAYPDYNLDGFDKELESAAMFRAIARAMSPTPAEAAEATEESLP